MIYHFEFTSVRFTSWIRLYCTAAVTDTLNLIVGFLLLGQAH